MENLKNKTMAIMITLLLTTSMSAMLLLQPTSAHTPAWQIPTIAEINVAPNPIGVGQAVNVGFWINAPPPTASMAAGDRWTNLAVTVTHPDGTIEKLGPFTSDDTGGTHMEYTPTAVGTYTFQMSFPGQTLAGNNPPTTGWSPAITAFIGDYYEPSNSSVATLTVQQEPVGGVSVAPLPTNYWQTPINAMNVNNWYAIGGAWLGFGSTTGHGGMYNSSSNYNPYTTAPKSAHILWTKPEAFGGVLGGQYGGSTTYGNYYATAQYEKKFSAVIINGYLYYDDYPGSSTTPTGLLCVDLFTGQTVWTDNANNFGGGSPQQTALTASGLVTTLLCGQMLDFVTPNQYGGLAYLWTTGTPAGITVKPGTTTLNMFDAKTGTYILSIVNGTSTTLTEDDSGNLIGYYVNATAGTQIIQSTPLNDNTGPVLSPVTTTGPSLNEWNSTLCIMTAAWNAQMAGWGWRPPQNGIIPFNDGIMYSMPLATNISGNAFPANLGIYAINSGIIICNAYSPGGSSLFRGPYTIYAGYSQTTGQQLWVENLTVAPFVAQSGAACTSDQMTCGNGVFTIADYQNSVLRGCSMTTGKVLWTDNLSPSDPYDSIGGWMMTLANGTLYIAGFGGDIWSIDMLTGNINWYTNTTALQGPSGTNTPYGIWPIWTFSNGGIADGTLFLEEGHEYSPPLFLGAQQLAINCTTGKLTWSIDAFDVDSIPYIAYGVMTILNAYDNQIYAYGMGPTAMTVTAPDVGVTTATPITIRGTITDISAGTKQEAQVANFPDGLPCVSDASQSAWMEYAYMQQPMPTNTTGVPIAINVVDSNGNSRQIGTTTSKADGTFSINWTPDISGAYTVTASFAGTNSYYPSSAGTSFYASEPAPTATPSPIPPQSVTDMYFVPAIACIIIAIAIVGVVILFAIRKRPTVAPIA